jgi:hypothetical protein
MQVVRTDLLLDVSNSRDILSKVKHGYVYSFYRDGDDPKRDYATPVFSFTIRNYQICCGIREVGAFAVYYTPTKEEEEEMPRLFKENLQAHAATFLFSLAHVTLTRGNEDVFGKDHPRANKILQPEWLVKMLEEWPGATSHSWIKNRNSPNDIKMYVLPV